MNIIFWKGNLNSRQEIFLTLGMQKVFRHDSKYYTHTYFSWKVLICVKFAPWNTVTLICKNAL